MKQKERSKLGVSAFEGLLLPCKLKMEEPVLMERPDVLLLTEYLSLEGCSASNRFSSAEQHHLVRGRTKDQHNYSVMLCPRTARGWQHPILSAAPWCVACVSHWLSDSEEKELLHSQLNESLSSFLPWFLVLVCSDPDL